MRSSRARGHSGRRPPSIGLPLFLWAVLFLVLAHPGLAQAPPSPISPTLLRSGPLEFNLTWTAPSSPPPSGGYEIIISDTRALLVCPASPPPLIRLACGQPARHRGQSVGPAAWARAPVSPDPPRQVTYRRRVGPDATHAVISNAPTSAPLFTGTPPVDGAPVAPFLVVRGESYTAYLASIGPGGESSGVVAAEPAGRVAVGVSSPPRNLTACPVVGGGPPPCPLAPQRPLSLRLAWSPPSDPGAGPGGDPSGGDAVTVYHFRLSSPGLAGATHTVLASALAGAAPPYLTEVAGLARGASYSLEAMAENGVGGGNWTFPPLTSPTVLGTPSPPPPQT